MSQDKEMNPLERQWKDRLRAAVHSEQAPPFLEARIRSQLRSQPRRAPWFRLAASFSTAAALCAGVIISYELGHLRLTQGSRESYVQHVSLQVATLMRVGMGNHLHCSYFGTHVAKERPLDEAVLDLDPKYRGLVPLVRAKVPSEYLLDSSHECRYHGRRFVHLSLMRGNQLASLIITLKNPGESFEVEGILPALTQAGIPIYTSGAQRFDVASFESKDYLVYFVSDLGRETNRGLMMALAPTIKQFLSTLEG